MVNFKQLVSQLSQQAQRTNHRYVLVLAGDEPWAIELLIETLNATETFWLGHGDWASCIAINQYKSMLGQECSRLVFNGYSGFNPDAFGAASGTLVGGGLCFIITPSLATWPQFNDPDYLRYVADAQQVTRVTPCFITRAISLFEHQDHCYMVNQTQPVPMIETAVTLNKLHDGAEQPYATVEQQQVVELIIKTVTGHRRRPLVISADRGRGKSAALGIAAAHLLTHKVDRILVSSPHVGAIQTLLKHASSLLDGATVNKYQLDWRGKSICFVAPDQLINQLPDCDLLLIDEAAAIPTNMLEIIATHYSRLVFATTIHGYEGTGRGFVLRFLKQLSTIAPAYRRVTMQQPIRWNSGDPFEQLSGNLLGLNTNAANVDSLVGADISNRLILSTVTAQQLVKDAELLDQVFGLLVLAHYQTSASDFRQLLDAPDLTIFIATVDGLVVATALVLREDQITAALAEKIWLGQRRLRGQLIPQSLIAHVGLQQAGDYTYARIMRIAVQPQLHRQGIGCLLNQFIEQWAVDNQLDFIGASFGATASLIDYWLSLGYQTVRLGITRDAASGTHSAMVLKTINQSEGNRALLVLAQTAFQQNFHYTVVSEFKTLEHQMVVSVLKNITTLVKLTTGDHSNIAVYTESPRPFELVGYSIVRLIWCSNKDLSKLSSSVQYLLVAKVLQQQPWNEVIKSGKFSGRKTAEIALKQAVSQLYNLATNPNEMYSSNGFDK